MVVCFVSSSNVAVFRSLFFLVWKMISAQSIFQITVALIFLFAGPWIFGLTNLAEVGGIVVNTFTVVPPPGWPGSQADFVRTVNDEKTLLRSIIFNTFVFMQMWNEIKWVFVGK